MYQKRNQFIPLYEYKEHAKSIYSLIENHTNLVNEAFHLEIYSFHRAIEILKKLSIYILNVNMNKKKKKAINWTSITSLTNKSFTKNIFAFLTLRKKSNNGSLIRMRIASFFFLNKLVEGGRHFFHYYAQLPLYFTT